MINSIKIDNFKLFSKEICIGGLNKINLLTGVNGRGKSTTLQPLLLLKQALMKQSQTRQVPLNGSIVTLGAWQDVKNVARSNNDTMTFLFDVDGTLLQYELHPDETNKQVLISSKEIADKPFKNVIYVSADRIGPKLQYNATSDSGWFGKSGEFTTQVLHHRKDDVISDSLLKGIAVSFPNDDIDVIQHTVEGVLQFWLSKIFKENVIVKTDYIEETGTYTLSMHTGNGYFKPTNLGFGYSYILPILVAGLTSAEGTTLIVENPESHLHPSAQSVITKFLGLVANHGVQVFIETHSEHVLNALRVMVVQETLVPKDINVMYFNNTSELYKPLEISSKGKVNEWPAGFFDQNEIDLGLLLGCF